MRAIVSREAFEDEDLYWGIPGGLLGAPLCGPFEAGSVLTAFDAVPDGPVGAVIVAGMAGNLAGRGELPNDLLGIGYAGEDARGRWRHG